METLYFAAGIAFLVILQVINHLVTRREMRDLKKLHLGMVHGISRDLNSIVSTIALYSGADVSTSAQPAPNGGEPSLEVSEAARRKAQLWINARQGRGAR